MVIWAVGRFIASLGKKKSGNVSNKQQQAVEEQQRRRAAYEAAQKDQGRQEQVLREQLQRENTRPEHPWQTGDWQLADGEPSHPAQQPTRRTMQRNVQRPKTLTQAQRQLYAPTPPSASTADSAPAAASPLTAQTAPAAPHQRHVPAAEDPQVRRGGVSLQGNALVQGIIMAEVLGPPRSKRKQIR